MNSSTARWLELDALRGFAVLGIFWVNIIYLGWPYGAIPYPILFGGIPELNILSWGFIHLLVEGAMFALFSMLFGASALMLLGEQRLAGPMGLRAVDHYYRRNLWLIGFGLIHAFVLLWPLEILFSYGVLGLALFPLRNLKSRTLLISGVVLVAWGTYPLLPLELLPEATETIQQQATPPAPSSNAELLLALEVEQEIADIQAEMALYHSDYPAIFLGNIEVAIGQQTTNLYESNIWDAGGMMLVGMALFKWGVLTGERSLVFYLTMMLLGFTLAIFLRLPGVSASISSGFDSEQIHNIASVPNLMGRLPLALGYIGLIMLLCRWGLLSNLTRALADTGRLAFTNYITQTLFAIFVFYGFGLGLFGKLTFYQLIMTAMLFGGMQILVSVFWLKYFHQGPLEWLWRSLVHLKLLPFRKPALATPKNPVLSPVTNDSLPLP
jgi:uncharacterized protein